MGSTLAIEKEVSSLGAVRDNGDGTMIADEDEAEEDGDKETTTDGDEEEEGEGRGRVAE